MGVRRVQITPELIAAILRDGVGSRAEAIKPIDDAKVLDARLVRPYGVAALVELLIESPTFDGLSSEGNWPAIAEGRWDQFPVFLPTFRVTPEPLPIFHATGISLLDHPGELELIQDPDDRHGDVAGA